MARQHAAAQHELAGAVGRVGRPVERRPVNRAAEAQADADLGHAVARHEGARRRSPGRRRSRRSGRSTAGRIMSAPTPASVRHDRSRSPGICAWRAAGDQVVAEARAVGDGGAASRDQRQPLQRPAREVARRQIGRRCAARTSAPARSRSGPCRDRAAASSRRNRRRRSAGSPASRRCWP